MNDFSVNVEIRTDVPKIIHSKYASPPQGFKQLEYYKELRVFYSPVTGEAFDCCRINTNKEKNSVEYQIFMPREKGEKPTGRVFHSD